MAAGPPYRWVGGAGNFRRPGAAGAYAPARAPRWMPTPHALNAAAARHVWAQNATIARGARLPRVGVVCITRDEAERIGEWASYYLAVLRAAKVFVFDNGASEAELAPMRRALAPFVRAGLVVHTAWSSRDHPSYAQIGAYNADAVHGDGSVEWLLYVDVDELLVLRAPSAWTLPQLALLLERVPGPPVAAALVNQRFVGRQRAPGSEQPARADAPLRTVAAMRAQTHVTDESCCHVPVGVAWCAPRAGTKARREAGCALVNAQVKTMARRGERPMGLHKLQRRGARQVRLTAGLVGCSVAGAGCCALDFSHAAVNHYHATSDAEIERIERRGWAVGYFTSAGGGCDAPLVWENATASCVEPPGGARGGAPRQQSYRAQLARAVDARAERTTDAYLAGALADRTEAFARAMAGTCDSLEPAPLASAVRQRCRAAAAWQRSVAT